MMGCKVDGRVAGWIGAAMMIAAAACGPVVEPMETVGEDDDGDDDGTDTGAGTGTGTDDESTGAGPTTTTITTMTTSMSVTSEEPTTDGPVLDNITGDHLLAVAAVIAPDTPLQFLATVSHEETLVRMSLQPLSLDPASTTEPRKPVGAPLQVVGEIAPDGTFVLDLGEVLVTGEANPITGSDIVATMRMEGTVQGPDLWCGDVTGFVTSPLMLDLTGSTFAGTRVTGELPGDPIVASCGG